MKVLCLSLWQNSWIPYWSKYLNDRGHEVRWAICNKVNADQIKEHYDWCDIAFSLWAIGWTNLITKQQGWEKPFFVMHRSFECFNDSMLGMRIKEVNWNKVTKLFMLNESHAELFKRECPDVQPIFVKNGIDLDYWKFQVKGYKAWHNIAWIANLNHKKGEMLAAHAIAELQKDDPLVQLYHIGKIDSLRIELYLQNIAPYFHSTWYSHGFENKHDYVKNFLIDKRYILSSSLVEGHPLNILEAMATGCKPLIHRYPGVEHQFPEKYIWNTFDDLRRIYAEPYNAEEYRQFIVDKYDYRKTYKPIVDLMEEYA